MLARTVRKQVARQGEEAARAYPKRDIPRPEDAKAASTQPRCELESKVITAFDLWLQKDARQRVLWPATIQLSLDYFASLQEHAVPLHEADLAALAHSAMALDLYAWLAQRLHRIDPHRPAFIQWPALMQQFGPGYGRMSNPAAGDEAAAHAPPQITHLDHDRLVTPARARTRGPTYFRA